MDHVIPKLLFDPVPQDIVTVPACPECNSRKKLDDEFLRDMLVTDPFTAKSEEAARIKQGAFTRSVRTNRSEFGKFFKKHAKKDRFRTKGGIVLGEVYSAPLDVERLCRTFAKMVQGLHYRVRGTLLPPDTLFEIRRVFPYNFPDLERDLQNLKANVPYRIGESFQCWYCWAAENNLVCFWLLLFYGGFAITVWTNTDPSELDSPYQLRLDGQL